MLASFSGSVTLSDGRTVSVQPLTQIVWPMVACVTAGFSAPGVHAASGSEERPEPFARQDPGAGCAWTEWALALDATRRAAGGAVVE
jgi:hypothetical protein